MIAVTTPTALGICITATILVFTLIFASCYCYRRRRRAASHLAAKLGGSSGKHRHSTAGSVASGVNQPLAWNTHRKPTAVKSPAGANPTHYLKKSPSPTGASKSPPGVSASCDTIIENCLSFFQITHLFFIPSSYNNVINACVANKLKNKSFHPFPDERSCNPISNREPRTNSP